MPIHVYVFLLVVCLLFCLAPLWRHNWLHLQPCSTRGGAKRSALHRLLKPRSPDDCPACRLASPAPSALMPAPVRPWSEVKSLRGAPKCIDTHGYACPNQQCRYFGITEAHLHALVGDGKHGRASRSKPFAVRRAAPRSTLNATPPYIA